LAFFALIFALSSSSPLLLLINGTEDEDDWTRRDFAAVA